MFGSNKSVAVSNGVVNLRNELVAVLRRNANSVIAHDAMEATRIESYIAKAVNAKTISEIADIATYARVDFRVQQETLVRLSRM